MTDHWTCLGFDFGERHIGVAVGQTVTASASPVTTLAARHGKPDWSELDRLVDQWRPRALVVGLPCRDDGSDYPVAEGARRFARRLHGRYGLPAHLTDERLTSVAAERHLGKKLGRRGDYRAVDSLAASILLQAWLGEQCQKV